MTLLCGAALEGQVSSQREPQLCPQSHAFLNLSPEKASPLFPLPSVEHLLTAGHNVLCKHVSFCPFKNPRGGCWKLHFVYVNRGSEPENLPRVVPTGLHGLSRVLCRVTNTQSAPEPSPHPLSCFVSFAALVGSRGRGKNPGERGRFFSLQEGLVSSAAAVPILSQDNGFSRASECCDSAEMLTFSRHGMEKTRATRIPFREEFYLEGIP